MEYLVVFRKDGLFWRTFCRPLIHSEKLNSRSVLERDTGDTEMALGCSIHMVRIFLFWQKQHSSCAAGIAL